VTLTTIVYGLPLVMNYAVFYGYFGDKSGPEFKAEPNHLCNIADTPYSFVAMIFAQNLWWSAIPPSRNLDISPCSSSTCTHSISDIWAAARPAMMLPVR
jgi:hypothetical protein